VSRTPKTRLHAIGIVAEMKFIDFKWLSLFLLLLLLHFAMAISVVKSLLAHRKLFMENAISFICLRHRSHSRSLSRMQLFSGCVD
jgi:cell division protein FtsL